ncbi:MAG: ATP-binding protein [Patescibacteria group bacterium]
MTIKTIKGKIVYITLVIVSLSGLISLSLVAYLSYDRNIKDKQASLSSVVHEQASKIDVFLKESRNLSQYIAELEEITSWVESPNEEARQSILNLLDQFNINNSYSALYLLSASGTTLVSTDHLLDGKNYSFRSYYLSAINGKQGLEMAIGASTGKPGYYFSSPIKNKDGLIIGAAVLKMEPDSLNKILSEMSLNVDSKLMFSDEDGIILYSNLPERIYQSLGHLDEKTLAKIKEQKKFSNIEIKALQYDEISAIINNGVEDVVVKIVSDKVEKEEELLTVAPIGDTKFFLVIETEFDTLITDAINLAILLGLLVLLSTIIAIFWISVMASKNLKPLLVLREMSENLGRGKYVKINPINSGDDLEELGAVFTKMSKQLENSYGDLETRVKDRTSELEIKNKFLEDAKKATINILEDVQEEKDKTIKLADDLEKFKLALDNASDHIVITDSEGITLYGNKGLERITGYDLKEVIGKKVGSLWSLPMQKNFYKNLWKTIKTDKKYFEGDIRNRRKNGEEYDAHISISPVVSSKNEVEFFVGIERDVTHEKNVDRTKTEFVSLASHQLRTPLSSINWYAEMLLAGDGGKLNEEQSGFVKEIYTGNQRMVELVNSLLNVSRLELGTFAVGPQPTDVIKTAQEVLSELKPGIAEKKLKLSFDYDKTIPIISADPKLLRIVFQNLLSNSVKYTPEKGTVKLILNQDKKNLLVTVADNGYGIPKSQHDKIFSKLFRADNVRAKDTEGTGLGLYIIKSIVDHFGGTIRFESEEDKGTTFYLSLPLTGMKKKVGNRGLE